MLKHNNISKTILDKIESKNLFRRYIVFIFGLLLYAIAYNVFFVQTDLILGGSGGIAILLKKFFNPSVTILFLSVISLLLSAIFMDKQFTINSVVGSLLSPVFVELTKDIHISLPNDDMMLVAICGAVLIGIANGLTSKTGLSSGGIDTIIHILTRKLKISQGRLYLYINGLIILCGGYFYGWRIMLYALIVLYIVSIITDKVVLGISNNKSFYIVTSEVEEVKKYLTDTLNRGVTIIDAVGGFTNNRQDVIMVVIPTSEYFKAKEGILDIDPHAFITITDSYQAFNQDSHRKKKKGVK